MGRAISIATMALLGCLGCTESSRPPPPPVDSGLPGRDFGPIMTPCEDGNPSYAGLPADLTVEEWNMTEAQQMCDWQRLLFGSGSRCVATDIPVVVLASCEDDFLDWGSVGCTVTACEVEDCSYARKNMPCDEMPPECAGIYECVARYAGM